MTFQDEVTSYDVPEMLKAITEGSQGFLFVNNCSAQISFIMIFPLSSALSATPLFVPQAQWLEKEKKKISLHTVS